tara:strand:- start:3781 stop:4017 length:237 start_codon:yes stop_codon:yes gene_type:complete
MIAVRGKCANQGRKKMSSRRIYQDLKIRKGNIYSYLDDEVHEWLLDEAIKLGRCDVALVIAAIVKDAYAEEREDMDNG